jgi:hypothetical protein
MPRKTDAELGRIVRQALKGHRLKPRRLYGPTPSDAIRRLNGDKGRSAISTEAMESDRDFLENNNDAAVALLEALAPIKRTKHCTQDDNEPQGDALLDKWTVYTPPKKTNAVSAR